MYNSKTNSGEILKIETIKSAKFTSEQTEQCYMKMSELTAQICSLSEELKEDHTTCS